MRRLLPCLLQEGDLADSRKRRAALDAEQEASDSLEESSSDSDSDDDKDESDKKASAEVDGNDVSDDEAKALLHRYQQQKVLTASQACL